MPQIDSVARLPRTTDRVPQRRNDLSSSSAFRWLAGDGRYWWGVPDVFFLTAVSLCRVSVCVVVESTVFESAERRFLCFLVIFLMSQNTFTSCCKREIQPWLANQATTCAANEVINCYILQLFWYLEVLDLQGAVKTCTIFVMLSKHKDSAILSGSESTIFYK